MFQRFLLIFSFLIITTMAHAQMSLADDSDGPKVKAQVIAENDGITPGKPFQVALRQEITPGWHTYWRNPGDTGLETKVEWQLPPGFSASELHFPTPHRQPTGGLMNFGYEESVMILADIMPPADLHIGDEVEIKGKASWLVCADICIPESASFLLTLPVVDTPAPGPWASAFNATRQKMPQPHRAKQDVGVTDETITVTIDPLPLPADQIPDEAFFFPHDGQLIQHNAAQKLDLNGRKATLTLQKTKTRTAPIETVAGDIWFRNAEGEASYQFTATVPQAVKAAVPVGAVSGNDGVAQSSLGFLSAIMFAFLGGLILNLMPCVFPVLSLKALALVHKAHHESRRDVITGGIIYTLGVLATFAVLGVVLVTLKAAGHHVGWGAQLQSPKFVAAMALLLFFIGYALSGALTLDARWIGIGSTLAHKSGWTGAFFTGALAVIVATPCTAPFMGGAVFYALTQHWIVTLCVMLAMGLGLAFPYLFLTLVPNALRFLPRPGVWMEYFKQFLAFPMWAAALWLVWVIAQQTGADGVLYVLGSMLSLAFGFWLWHTTTDRLMSPWQIIKRIVAVTSIVFALVLVTDQPATMQATAPISSVYYESYSAERLAELRIQNKPVFVNMTAAWCITCLANEKAALSSDKVRAYFKDNGITYLKGDWTNYDEGITQFLKNFGRSGVPIYVFYPADQTRAPIVLPQILTPDTVINAIQQPTTEKNP